MAVPFLDTDRIIADAGTEIIICCGSGGVGKTTTSAAVALRAAEAGRKVVVLTIDPARRLEEDERRETLTRLGLPLVDVSFDAGGIDEGSLFTLADQLRDQMPTEVA